MQHRMRWFSGTAIFGLLVVTVFLVGFFWSTGMSKGAASTASTTTVATSTTVTTPTNTSNCPNSWKRKDSNKAGHRWIADGVKTIRDAKTSAEARKGLADWLDESKKDPVLLTGVSSFVLKKNVSKDGLFDKNECATASAVALVEEIQREFVLADVQPAVAPPSATNSGSTSKTVVIDLTPGMSGDLRSARVELADGRVLFILWRCGNIATIAPPSLPKGPTDNTSSCPPGETFAPGIGCTPGKHASQSPVKSDPNSVCEACRPNTSEPQRAPAPTITTPPPGGTSDGGGHGDSGPGAQTTVPSPTTTQVAPAPPVTSSPKPPTSICVDPQGVGLCS